jgi:hypothetical protein
VSEFHSPLPNRDVERQLLNIPITTHITLPNLRWFPFKGVSAYLLARFSTCPQQAQISVFQPTDIHRPTSLAGQEILSFSTVWLVFGAGRVTLRRHYRGTWTSSPLCLEVLCRHLDWQVSSAAQILDILQPVLSIVEKTHTQPRKAQSIVRVAQRGRRHTVAPTSPTVQQFEDSSCAE